MNHKQVAAVKEKVTKWPIEKVWQYKRLIDDELNKRMELATAVSVPASEIQTKTLPKRIVLKKPKKKGKHAAHS